MNDLSMLSLSDPAVASCPFGYYKAMRKEEPVHFDEKLGIYLVTRFDDINKALRQPLVFSREQGFKAQIKKDYSEELDQFMISEGLGPIPLMTWDPPYHTKIRALMDKAFTGHRVAAMEPYITALTNELIDEFIEEGEADFLARLAIPLPIYVIADQLGVDRSLIDDFKRWSNAAVEPLGRLITKEREFECAREMIEMQRFMKAQIDDRRAVPGDDMISDLVHATLSDGTKLGLTELFSVIRALLVAGNETTTNAIANGLLLLARNPAVMEQLRSDPNQEKALLFLGEEILRLESPVAGLPRMATEDAELGGVMIPKGSHVLLCFASANRDDEKFDGPDKFDASRKNAPQHLAFGGGIYRCIGAPLARMEIRCVIREIMRRLSWIELTISEDEIQYAPSLVTRGITSLPLRFGKCA